MYFTDRDWLPFIALGAIGALCIALVSWAIWAGIQEGRKPAYSLPKDEWICSDHSVNPIYMSDTKGGLIVIPQTVCVQYTKIK